MCFIGLESQTDTLSRRSLKKLCRDIRPWTGAQIKSNNSISIFGFCFFLFFFFCFKARLLNYLSHQRQSIPVCFVSRRSLLWFKVTGDIPTLFDILCTPGPCFKNSCAQDEIKGLKPFVMTLLKMQTNRKVNLTHDTQLCTHFYAKPALWWTFLLRKVFSFVFLSKWTFE